MLNRKILTHTLGKQYRVHSASDGHAPRGLQAQSFADVEGAIRFLKRLNATASYWQRLANQLGLEPKYQNNQPDALGAIAQMLVKGRLRLFEVEPKDAQQAGENTKTRTLKNTNGELIRFAPAATALTSVQKTSKPFVNQTEAKNYINSLGADQAQLAEIAQNLGVKTNTTAATSNDLTDQLAQALIKEDIVLFVQKPYTKPPQGKELEEVVNIPGNRAVDLAPPPLKTWVEIKLLDDQGEPIAGEAYWIICPEGQKYEGTTNAAGMAKVSGILQGTCQVAFPNIEGSGIHQCSANVDCCTPAEEKTDPGAPAANDAPAPAGEASEQDAPAEPGTPPVTPIEDNTQVEPELAWAEFSLEDANGNPVADREFVLTDPDGTEHTGKTDASGTGRVENINPGECDVRFLPLAKTDGTSSTTAKSDTPATPQSAATPAPSDVSSNAAPPPTEETEEIPENYVDVAYYYADGTGVGGATFKVVNTDTNAEVASGTLPASGEMRVTIPVDVANVEVFFDDDPADVATVRESKPEVKEKPPEGWLDRMTQGLKDGADWTWELLQGDFNENPSVGQIITNAILTMIPVVDQIADARDLVAAIKQLAWDKRYDEVGPWVGFFFTLIGLVPVVGSALKGVLKMVWKGAKLDAILQVFNFFMKGNGVKWLKDLRAGKLAEYAKEAARIGHDVLDVVINQLRTLKDKLPKWFDDTHAQIQDILNSLQEVKKRINGQFEKIGQEMNEKLGKILSDAGEKIGVKGSAKGKVVKTQSSSPPKTEATSPLKSTRSAIEDRELISDLAKAGKIDEAREVLRPLLDSAKNTTSAIEKQKILDEIIERLDTSSSKEKIFWSGDSELAAKYAKNNNKTTLELTPGGSVINEWDEINSLYNYRDGWDLWGEVSERYASDAVGNIESIQTAAKFPKGGQIWSGREWPALYENPEVGTITIHSVDSNGNIIESLTVDSKSDEAIELFGAPL